jgi:hypothetical protein
MQYLLSDVIIDDVTVAVWIVFEKFLKKITKLSNQDLTWHEPYWHLGSMPLKNQS